MARLTQGAAASASGRVAGLAAIAALQTYWFLQPVPVAAKAVAGVVLLVSLAKPASGLLVFAGLAPLSTALATLCGGGTGLGGQLLEQMALSIGAGVVLRGGTPESRTRLGAPALLMAVVALASAASMMPAAAAPVARTLWDGLLLHQLAARATALTSPVWVPLFAALVVAECGLLGWAAERTVRRTPGLAIRLVAMALVGHAGAALLNLQALLGGALRSGDVWHALPRLLLTARISQQTDWNAAASALILAGIAGVGLLGKPWSRRAGVGGLLLIVAIGGWITGSRIAFVMGAAAIVAAIGWWGVHADRRARLMVGGIALLVLGLGAWLVIVNPAGRNYPISSSIMGRLEMARTGVQMFRSAPAFGIGITRFYEVSAGYDNPTRRTLVGGPRENAHNNFVQVLAEQGLVGLAALLWWLGAGWITAARVQTSTPDRVRGALLLAILACVGTWMTGHPLLVPEFAFVFCFFCGILAAMTPAPEPGRTRGLAAVLIATVAISVPVRASALRNAADLEHLGFALSQWQHDDDQRYREAGTSFGLYLPAGAGPVTVPLRRAPGTPDPLVVEASIDGHAVDRITIGGDGWQLFIVVPPPGPRRFALVDFAVHPAGPGGGEPAVLVRVGKAEAR